jgi:phosphoribosylaminoimidazolecarboxamide formyltransferase/IMP cyclohydrolase
MLFAWKVAKSRPLEPIVYAAKDHTLGIGAGQMRPGRLGWLGAEKARRPLTGSALASDAFFPLPGRTPTRPPRAASRRIIQPGDRSRTRVRSPAADEHDMTMVFTGYRHFKH